jgi:hypothetical protein
MRANRDSSPASEAEWQIGDPAVPRILASPR